MNPLLTNNVKLLPRTSSEENKLQTSVRNVEKNNITTLRRTLSHGNLPAKRQKYRDKLQRSQSDEELIYQPEKKEDKNILSPEVSVFEKYGNIPLNVGLDFRVLHNALAANTQSSPRTSSANQKTNYKFKFDELSEKHNELQQLSEQMNDIKTVDQDGSAAKLQIFLELREKEARMVRDELNRFQHDKKILSDILSQMAKDLINKDTAIKVQERNIQEKDSIIETYVRGLHSKEEFILEQVRTIQQKDEVLTEQIKRINERDDIIRRLEELTHNRDEINKKQAKSISDKENALRNLKKVIMEKEDLLTANTEELTNKEKAIEKLVKDLQHKEDVIRTQTKCLLDKEDRISDLSTALDEAENNVINLESNIREKEDQISKFLVEYNHTNKTLNNTKKQLTKLVEIYVENSSEAKTFLKSSEYSAGLVDLDNILNFMEEMLKKEIECIKQLKNENKTLSISIREEKNIKTKLEHDFHKAITSLKDLEENSCAKITSLELSQKELKDNLDILEREKNYVCLELNNINEKYRQSVESEKLALQKLSEIELELDSFRKQVIQTTFAIPGTLPPSGRVSTKSVVTAIEQLATERNEMSRKIAELKGQLRQYKLTQQEENISRNVIQDILKTAEDTMKLKGRWQLILHDIINKIQSVAIADSLEWIREFVLEIYRKENRWQINIEQALDHCNFKPASNTIDCGEMILHHFSNLSETIRQTEQTLNDFKEKFEDFKEDTKMEKAKLEEFFKSQTDTMLEQFAQQQKLEIEKITEKLKNEGEMFTQLQVEKAVANVQEKSNLEKELVLSEKNNEIEELKKTVEENFSLLEQKEGTIKEISEKLQEIEQEYEGKLQSLKSSQDVIETTIDKMPLDDKIIQLNYDINKLRDVLEEKEKLVEDLKGEIKVLQEKSSELAAERTRRPSTIPGSRKGRYAMNLERLVQNLSIENASYKLQLDQRDTVISELRHQISSVKRHSPFSLSELQQREKNELLEQLKERENQIENLCLNLEKNDGKH